MPASGIGLHVDNAGGTDLRQRRTLGMQPTTEFSQKCAVALHFDENSTRIVADESGQAQLVGDPVNEGTEADPLDDTGHGEALPDVIIA